MLIGAMLLGATWAIGLVAPDGSTARTGAPAPVAPAPAPEAAAEEPESRPVPQAAVDVAERWAAAWVFRPGQGREQWLDRLRPLSTDEYLGLLDSEGDHEAAARGVTGPAEAVEAADGSAVVDVPTDLLRLRIDLVDNGPAGWQVSAVGDADAGR